MTFKHVKFEDSPTMRALEKVAREKGLVKPEPLTKKASLVKKADLTPTDNLMQNVVKLCAGLRERGLVKDAAELETKYFQYKQAQTMYDATGETGEDLLEQAHPDGSHKLENVDSVEAVVEDLLDKHDLIKEVAEEEPKGELPEGKKSTAKDILRAVRIALAQSGTEQMQKLRDDSIAKIRVALTAVRKIVEKASPELSVRAVWVDEDAWQELLANPTIDKIKGMQSSVESGISTIKPGWSGGISDDTWAILQPAINQARSSLAAALTDRQKIIEIQNKVDSGENVPEEGAGGAGATPGGQANPSQAKINQAKQAINGIAGLVAADTTADPNDVKDVNAWIAKIRAALKTLEDSAKDMNPADVDAALAKITKDFATVRQEWA